MRTIREILLTEYIGAILIGVLIADAFSNLFTIVTEQITYYSFFVQHDLPATPFRASYRQSILNGAIRIVLFLASSYLLAHWLYKNTRLGENQSNAVAPEER